MKKVELEKNPKQWAVILAGGEGKRLQPLTRVIAGDDRPKQFCSIFGGLTLLDQTRLRVSLSVPDRQTLTLVTQAHERFYKPSLISDPQYRLIVQPKNKGTAPAILLSLLRVKQLSPDATVAFFPSDHHVRNDMRFMAHVDSAFLEANRQPNMIVLLGIQPESPEVHYGWIQPEIAVQPLTTSRVKAFWEKPDAKVARDLMRKGCLWNSFVMIGRVEAFIRLLRLALPDLSQRLTEIACTLGTTDERSALQRVYSQIDSTNFSTEVLALWSNHLLVSEVSDVGWCDLGEPRRALSAIQRNGVESLRLAGLEQVDHRASITYLRHYFETISLSRRSGQAREKIESLAAGAE